MSGELNPDDAEFRAKLEAGDFDYDDPDPCSAAEKLLELLGDDPEIAQELEKVLREIDHGLSLALGTDVVRINAKEIAKRRVIAEFLRQLTTKRHHLVQANKKRKKYSDEQRSSWHHMDAELRAMNLGDKYKTCIARAEWIAKKDGLPPAAVRTIRDELSPKKRTNKT